MVAKAEWVEVNYYTGWSFPIRILAPCAVCLFLGLKALGQGFSPGWYAESDRTGTCRRGVAWGSDKGGNALPLFP